MSQAPTRIEGILIKGRQFLTTKPVTFSSRMVSIGPWAYQGGPRINLPAGSVITYTGDYMFGSDPGPGFPEFDIKTPTGEALHGHACGAELEYWGRLVAGWCNPMEPANA